MKKTDWFKSSSHVLILSLLSFFVVDIAFSMELNIREIRPFPLSESRESRAGQLPQSWIATGGNNIRVAWFAGATDRYRHGVLGDSLEASTLIVETAEGNQHQVILPQSRVFEDLEPRLADINGDSQDDVIVIESHIDKGASLAVYSVEAGQLIRIAATPFLGRRNRWLNPVGVGDFDGNGQLEIALVSTPHIGGRLRLYRLQGSTLSLFAEYTGVSTHRIGSTQLGLGRVVKSTPRDRILLPNQSHQALLLLEWGPNGWKELTRTELSGQLGSSLIIMEENRWRFRLTNGNSFELSLVE